MNAHTGRRIATVSLIVVLAALTIILFLKGMQSARWRMEHDTPLLQYVGFLMDQCGLCPYRDIFDINMPGTCVFHFLIGRLFGYEDLAYRYVDLFLLGVLSLTTYFFMRRFGSIGGWGAAIVFPLIYLGHGQTVSLQRDYVGVIPIALALLWIPAKSEAAVGLRRFAVVGALFGMSLLVKPHLIIGFPIVCGALLAMRWNQRDKSGRDFLRISGVAITFLLFPALLTLIWLIAKSALGDFTAIYSDYVPLYTALSGSHETMSGSVRTFYLIVSAVKFGGYGVFLLCAFLACYHFMVQAPHRQGLRVSAIVVFLCTAAYALYPVFAGKFWPYHYMPFAYFVTLSCAMCLYGWPRQSEGLKSAAVRRGAFSAAAFVVAVFVHLNVPSYAVSTVLSLKLNVQGRPPKEGRVDEIADWLKPRLSSSDTVQPLDWTGGAVHAMLISRAKPATKFLYDYHFYHNLSSLHIQELRRTFINELKSASPKFIIEIISKKPWVSGVDTTRDFPDLRYILQRYYKIAKVGDGYRIHERVREIPSP